MKERDERKELLLKASYSGLDDLIRGADIISLHCPLTDATRNLVGVKELALMKNTGIIINVARGEVMDENALSKALAEKKIAGAGIDVYSGEPIAPGNPLLSLSEVNLILTPHSAGTTLEARTRIAHMAFSNIAKVLEGREPDNIVN